MSPFLNSSLSPTTDTTELGLGTKLSATEQMPVLLI